MIQQALSWPVWYSCQSLAGDKDTSGCQSIPALINTDRWSARVQELTGPASDQSGLWEPEPLFHRRNKPTASRPQREVLKTLRSIGFKVSEMFKPAMKDSM